MDILFEDRRVRKARKYWCRYRYRALKRKNNSELLRKLDDVEKMLMPLEKQGNEIRRYGSKSELMDKIKSQLLEIKEELKNSEKMGLFAMFFIHRIRSARKRWSRLRLKVLDNKPSDERDRLLDKLDSIEDDLQTVEEGRVSSRSDKRRILGSVEKSLSEMKGEIKGKAEKKETKEDVLKEEVGKPTTQEGPSKSAEGGGREKPLNKMSLEEIEEEIKKIEKESGV